MSKITSRMVKIGESFPPRAKLKILFVTTEMALFAKAGGLGDVMHSLPWALFNDLGQDVRLIMPRYGTIDPAIHGLKIEYRGLKVPTDQPGPDPYLICNVKKYSGDKSVPTYFLENNEYYEKRANVYGYSDDHIRWALLCRGMLEFLKKSSWVPDIIVASDWQTGLVSNYLKTIYKDDPILSSIIVVFTIHNLGYQGMCDFRFIQETDRDSGREEIPDFFNPRLAKLNWMLRGIIHSDVVTSVSPTYVKEILTPEYGEGLDKVLFEKQHNLYGILNGLNYDFYNPKNSPNIPVNYSVRSIERKKENKEQLQKRFGLTQDPNVFLVSMVSRLTEQKGFDLLEEILDPLLDNLSLQLVCLGDGESRYKEVLKKAMEKFPGRVGCLFEFDVSLPHLVFAGSDAILMPSKFEPCGMVQMQAMRYGCVPIVRETGGLADTVEDINFRQDIGDGFVFKNYTSLALFVGITRAFTVFGFSEYWIRVIKRAMQKDFSWTRSAKEYLKIFHQALQSRGRSIENKK